mmetsp:Transcript_33958/g.133215  ORF Transcript_33958/g.133215 Transcript_33958/m.133215 type:complete len:206 (+) Transcript_33958:392-1009(+)
MFSLFSSASIKLLVTVQYRSGKISGCSIRFLGLWSNVSFVLLIPFTSARSSPATYARLSILSSTVKCFIRSSIRTCRGCICSLECSLLHLTPPFTRDKQGVSNDADAHSGVIVVIRYKSAVRRILAGSCTLFIPHKYYCTSRSYFSSLLEANSRPTQLINSEKENGRTQLPFLVTSNREKSNSRTENRVFDLLALLEGQCEVLSA